MTAPLDFQFTPPASSLASCTDDAVLDVYYEIMLEDLGVLVAKAIDMDQRFKGIALIHDQLSRILALQSTPPHSAEKDSLQPQMEKMMALFTWGAAALRVGLSPEEKTRVALEFPSEWSSDNVQLDLKSYSFVQKFWRSEMKSTK